MTPLLPADFTQPENLQTILRTNLDGTESISCTHVI